MKRGYERKDPFESPLFRTASDDVLPTATRRMKREYGPGKKNAMQRRESSTDAGFYREPLALDRALTSTYERPEEGTSLWCGSSEGPICDSGTIKQDSLALL